MAKGSAPLSVTVRRVADLRPYKRNARTHSKAQIREIARSIEQLGFNDPVAVSDDDEIIAGHGRVEAAKLLGMLEVPTIRLSHLSDAERRAYVLASNKLATKAGWDYEFLATEFEAFIAEGFDIGVTGFALAEVDLTLDTARERSPKTRTGEEDVIPPMEPVAVSRLGDLWELGRHRVLCGDARDPDAYARLLKGESADMIFTDPPYNVPIDGHVCGSGRIRHREFAMAAGEMSEGQFTAFLQATLGAMASVSRDGAIAFVCIDWRHMSELLTAGKAVFSELKNLCVWNKSNGGMGSFYRSKHELVFVFKVGEAEHINTFGLGGTGRSRSNVWDYAGISSMTAERQESLSTHPTVKPTALVADAIRDCSKRGGVILDGFGGSGTTLLASELCGRSARLIEFDPFYVDATIRRYERSTGKRAHLEGGALFEDVQDARLEEAV